MRAQHVDEAEAGRVERDVLDHELGAGRDRRRDHEERGRRRVARARRARTARARPAATRTVEAVDRRPARRARRACARCGRARRGRRRSRSCPSAWSPARSSAVFTCALATASSWRMPAQRAAADRRAARASPSSRPSTCAPIARSGSTTGAIGRCAQRRVAGEHVEERAAREHAGEHAHRRARVAAVEHVVRLAPARRRRAPTRPCAAVARATFTPSCVERGARRAATSSPVGEVRDRAAAVGERGEQQRAVRDRLVAGHADACRAAGARRRTRARRERRCGHGSAVRLDVVAERRAGPSSNASAPSAATTSTSTPRAAFERVRDLEVGDVHAELGRRAS